MGRINAENLFVDQSFEIKFHSLLSTFLILSRLTTKFSDQNIKNYSATKKGGISQRKGAFVTL